MQKKYLALSVAVVTLLSASCATLFTGTSQDIKFTSEPEGAEIHVDGINMGTTPATVKVKKPGMLKDRKVTLKLEGYEDKTFVLQTEFQLVSVLNLANFVFWGIDVLTGSVMKYDKEEHNVVMESSNDQVKLQDLPRDAEGNYLLTQADGDLTVVDEESGHMFHWKR